MFKYTLNGFKNNLQVNAKFLNNSKRGVDKISIFNVNLNNKEFHNKINKNLGNVNCGITSSINNLSNKICRNSSLYKFSNNFYKFNYFKFANHKNKSKDNLEEEDFGFSAFDEEFEIKDKRSERSRSGENNENGGNFKINENSGNSANRKSNFNEESKEGFNSRRREGGQFKRESNRFGDRDRERDNNTFRERDNNKFRDRENSRFGNRDRERDFNSRNNREDENKESRSTEIPRRAPFMRDNRDYKSQVNSSIRRSNSSFSDTFDNNENFYNSESSSILNSNIDTNTSTSITIKKLDQQFQKKFSKEELEKFYKENEIKMIKDMDVEVPDPIKNINEIECDSRIKDYFSAKFPNPTFIQSLSWPLALSGKNVVGIAETGSGKTLSFFIPALIHVQNNLRNRPNYKPGPLALIIAPTRELAMQIFSVVEEYSQLMRFRAACLYGGVPRKQQIPSVVRGVEIVVATPGRLLDLVDYGKTNLNSASFVVLDEADRMLDMGFEPQIRKIIEQIRPDRQVLMWSATWPKEVNIWLHLHITCDQYYNRVTIVATIVIQLS